MLKSLLLAAAALAGAEGVRHYNTTSQRLKGVINVHFVAHTHDDVGWLKTVDQYYYGAHNEIQRAVVQNILNSVTKELYFNPDRKFIYVEQAFFQRWWEEQTPNIQTMVKQIVANGQLEFINGGWCMHDEANPSYVDMLDQTTLGHRLLLQEFNVTPKATWQIDPFGHSTFQAWAMSSPLSGYNSVFFARADYQDVNNRNIERTSEMIWAPSPSKGMNAATYAGILYGGYCTIGGISMDIGSNDAPVMDDTTLEDYNVGQVVDGVVGRVLDAVSKYPQGNVGADGTADVLLPLGCDFNYENAATWFTNTDKVIHWLNQDGRVNAFYSTPSIYAAAKLETGKTYTLKTDDFMPYADGPHAYWTGYFTSRAALKGYIRDTSSYFQAAKQLQAFSGGAADMTPSNPLYRLERALSVAQHHDAVAGTSKQAVAYDYARRLAWGRQDGDALISSALGKLTGYSTVNYAGCDLANATICPALEPGVATVLVVYNQQGQSRGNAPLNIMIPVGLPSGVATYQVLDHTAAAVTAQVLPLSASDASVRTQYYKYNSSTPVSWLAFQSTAVPAAGYAVFFLLPQASVTDAPSTHISKVVEMKIGGQGRGLRTTKNKQYNLVLGDQTLSNGVVSLTLDSTTGLLYSYSNTANGITAPLTQTFYWYNSSVGNADDGQASGAYIFRPNSSATFDVSTNGITLTLVTGPIVNEARQSFATWASQTIRLWASATTVDFDYTIGPIPWSDGLGKEIISRYSIPGMTTNGTWWTDSNGRDSNKRIYNYRPSWNLTVHEPVAGNYYPINAFIATSDVTNGHTLSVNVDRSQAGGQVAEGSVEVMVQRRLQHDDGRGVGEPLNETGLDQSGDGLVIRGTHRLSLDASPSAGAVSRRASLQDLYFKPIIRSAPLASGSTPSAWLASYKGSFTGLQAALPSNVHLLTVHSWGPTTLLLRVAHSFETNEDTVSGNSANVTLNLASIFTGITLSSCTETTLTANQPLSAVPKTTYNVTGGPAVTLPILPAPPAGASMTITLEPMDIRTFMCVTAPQDA